jgi:hypothetical protein
MVMIEHGNWVTYNSHVKARGINVWYLPLYKHVPECFWILFHNVIWVTEVHLNLNSKDNKLEALDVTDN